MNKLVTTALAVAAAGSLSHADPGDNDWLELDGEINDLATALTPAQDGMGWSALIRANFLFSNDEVATGSPTAPDLVGFAFADVDLAFWGSVGNFGWRVSTDIHDNEGSENTEPGAANEKTSLVLEDAYVYWDCTEFVTLKLGNQKPRALRSGYIYPEYQLFIDRTVLGSTFDFWDNGLTAEGSWEGFDYAVQVFNSVETDAFGTTTGTPATASDTFWVIHAAWNFGDGAGMAEGASTGNDDLNFSVGFTYLQDDATGGNNGTKTGDGNLIAVDFNGSISQFGFGAEIMDLDNDGGRTLARDFGSGQLFGGSVASLDDDTTPWNLTGSFLLSPEWEIGARYEEIDDMADTSVLSAVINWYRSGSNAKLQAQWQNFNSDDPTADGNVFTIGLVVGASS